MKAIPYEIGRVVTSRQGHDKGRAFLVVGLIDERHVWIADGDTRKLAKPKKKQRMHLHAEPFVATDALAQIAAATQTADSAIRKALATSTHTRNPGSPRAERSTDKEEYALVQE